MSKFICDVCGEKFITNREILDFNSCIGCEQENPIVCKMSKDIHEYKKEINHLTIAYQNASDQRQHYVEKCLKLSEVVLEFADYKKDIDGWTSNAALGLNTKTIAHKHKDLINQLKHNIYLEVKGE